VSAYDHLAVMNTFHILTAVYKKSTSQLMHTFYHRKYMQNSNTRGQNYYLMRRKCDTLLYLQRFMHNEQPTRLKSVINKLCNTAKFTIILRLKNYFRKCNLINTFKGTKTKVTQNDQYLETD
jgi:hypothetical protein